MMKDYSSETPLKGKNPLRYMFYTVVSRWSEKAKNKPNRKVLKISDACFFITLTVRVYMCILKPPDSPSENKVVQFHNLHISHILWKTKEQNRSKSWNYRKIQHQQRLNFITDHFPSLERSLNEFQWKVRLQHKFLRISKTIASNLNIQH